jgi:hypothetical protein
MTIDEYKATLLESNPPPHFNVQLKSLWHDGKGNWEAAHDLAQEIHTTDGSWIHAYLHRKEGDRSNASYWYKMANKPFPSVSLDKEWEQLVENFLLH